MSGEQAAVVQALAAAITILGTATFALYEIYARRSQDEHDKSVNFSIACDVFSDTLGEFNRIYKHSPYKSESLKQPSLLFRANADVLQDLTFKPLPDRDRAKLLFSMRRSSYNMLSGIIALETYPDSQTTKDKLNDAFAEASALIKDPLFRRSDRTPDI